MCRLLILSLCTAGCYGSEASPQTNVVYDFILENLDCGGCNRSSNLNVSEMNIRFYNFETNSSAVYPIANASESILSRDDFDTNQCIILFVNGFLDLGLEDALCAMDKMVCNGLKPLGLITDNSAYTSGNIIKKLDIVNLYKTAVKYAKSIGVRLGTFVTDLLKIVDNSNLKIFGHSLGAHMAGLIGEVVKNETGSLLSTIYGIDPAGPCYTKCPEESFRSGQANVTVAFHCNSGEYGTTSNLSNFDFISYNGIIQESCGSGSSELFTTAYESACSHMICTSIVLNPTIYKDINIWQAVECSSSENYFNGTCENNKTAKAGFDIVPDSEDGVYYFSPWNNLTCNSGLLKSFVDVITQD